VELHEAGAGQTPDDVRALTGHAGTHAEEDGARHLTDGTGE